jgi:hypothetical protein
MSEPTSEEEEYLVQATLQLLGTKRREYMYCCSCGEVMRNSRSSLRICSDCLGTQCDTFEKVAEMPDEGE